MYLEGEMKENKRKSASQQQAAEPSNQEIQQNQTQNQEGCAVVQKNNSNRVVTQKISTQA